MGHITCVRGVGSPVVYIICDLVGKFKGFIKNYDWILVRTIRQCHLARWGENIRCQTVRPAKGVQSDRWNSCQISC